MDDRLDALTLLRMGLAPLVAVVEEWVEEALGLPRACACGEERRLWSVPSLGREMAEGEVLVLVERVAGSDVEQVGSVALG